MYDITLIGAGIMSTTLAKILKELDPNIRILILESMNDVALESSSAWNNAGTGHAGLCELNYTPYDKGKVDIHKALEVTESFEVSKQFWSYFITKYGFSSKDFIHTIPHMSFVDKDTNFLRIRFDTMHKHHFYDNMQYSDYGSVIRNWAPLSMEGRNLNDNVAATYVSDGTDVDFGNLSKLLTHSLITNGVKIKLGYEVTDIHRHEDNWRILFKTEEKTNRHCFISKRVFIGAGGATLLLLEKTGIPQSKLYGGFPIRGEWLTCESKSVVDSHNVKMYGKPDLGAPPMSVPHLDTRIINGKKELLFGPAAGFSTKFLKNGSYLDLFKSIKSYNIVAMLKAGYYNIPLTKYLINQVFQSFDDKIDGLKRYYPLAQHEDWNIKIAGQRVQVIKKDKKYGGVLQFGTETVVSDDGTISALLGASPGASTAVSIMINLIEKCFPEMSGEEWTKKMQAMIPSYKKSLINDKDLFNEVHNYTNRVLNIKK